MKQSDSVLKVWTSLFSVWAVGLWTDDMTLKVCCPQTTDGVVQRTISSFSPQLSFFFIQTHIKLHTAWLLSADGNLLAVVASLCQIAVSLFPTSVTAVLRLSFVYTKMVWRWIPLRAFRLWQISYPCCQVCEGAGRVDAGTRTAALERWLQSCAVWFWEAVLWCQVFCLWVVRGALWVHMHRTVARDSLRGGPQTTPMSYHNVGERDRGSRPRHEGVTVADERTRPVMSRSVWDDELTLTFRVCGDHLWPFLWGQ